jgi:hypothetical protein
LWCEDYGTKACNNYKLQQARALEYIDFRTIQLEGDTHNWKLNGSCFSPEFLSHYRPSARWSNPKLATDAEMWRWE